MIDARRQKEMGGKNNFATTHSPIISRYSFQGFRLILFFSPQNLKRGSAECVHCYSRLIINDKLEIMNMPPDPFKIGVVRGLL